MRKGWQRLQLTLPLHCGQPSVGLLPRFGPIDTVFTALLPGSEPP